MGTPASCSKEAVGLCLRSVIWGWPWGVRVSVNVFPSPLTRGFVSPSERGGDAPDVKRALGLGCPPRRRHSGLEVGCWALLGRCHTVDSVLVSWKDVQRCPHTGRASAAAPSCRPQGESLHAGVLRFPGHGPSVQDFRGPGCLHTQVPPRLPQRQSVGLGPCICGVDSMVLHLSASRPAREAVLGKVAIGCASPRSRQS